MQEALARFNITPEVLADAQSRVAAVADAESAQEKEKGNAQDATELRNAAVDALDDYAFPRANRRLIEELERRQTEPSLFD